MRAAARPWRRRLGARARTGGRRAEWIALIWLMLKGWRILGFRPWRPWAPTRGRG